MTNTRFDDRLETTLAGLRAAGEPFAIATVVRTVDATSAKPGAKAVILADGTIAEGWVGGGCARSAVGKAGAAAIRECRAQFISLRPEELLTAEGVLPGEERHGIRFARNGCPSKGSMDIFIEPVLPMPRLVVFGASPVALALSALAAHFDLHRTLAAPDLREGPAEQVQDGFALDAVPAGQRFIVVATQGKGDEAALRAALASSADSIAFVGSRRKFAALAERLRADGIDEAALRRVKAPAGLDIHAITPEEIALSILAEITVLRRSGGRGDADG
ncbi:MAG: XdhC family protein [Zhengella sp.]|uniref:XdhC family protein n=1 Tax=Zhengella sp. TaxID=2282762 RepID=UPI001D703461|nr:XdhC family protein [Notoacmeibacter sp.]MCC0027785.1 XdhC family protein [Brucellaceae bacterium]